MDSKPKHKTKSGTVVAGSGIYRVDADGLDCLHYACKEGHWEIVEWLIYEKKFNPNGLKFDEIVKTEKVDVLNEKLTEMPGIGKVQEVVTKEKFKWVGSVLPIHYAIWDIFHSKSDAEQSQMHCKKKIRAGYKTWIRHGDMGDNEVVGFFFKVRRKS